MNTDNASCPACGHYNAMLPAGGGQMVGEQWVEAMRCRDCGHTVEPVAAEVARRCARADRLGQLVEAGLLSIESDPYATEPACCAQRAAEPYAPCLCNVPRGADRLRLGGAPGEGEVGEDWPF